MLDRHSRKRSRALALGVVVLAFLGMSLVLADLAGCSASTARTLASEGGPRITLRATCLPGQPSCGISTGRDSAVGMLTTRLHDGLGLHDATAAPSGSDGIVVSLPGTSDSTLVDPVLMNRGTLQVLDTGDSSLPVGTEVTSVTCTTSCPRGRYPVMFTEAQLDRSRVGADLDRQSGRAVVIFAFAGAARQQFAAYTRDHINYYLTLAVDGRVVESAVIQSEIDDAAQISGLGTLHDATIIAAELKAGPLPVALTITGTEQVTPTVR